MDNRDLRCARAHQNDNRTGQLTKILNNFNHNKDRGYSYDALGRLVQATGGPSSSPLWTQTYTYDRYGNRTSVSASGYSAKNGSASAAPGLTARERGSSPTMREGSVANAITQPSDPRVDLPTDLLAKNNVDPRVSSPTMRDGSEALSDSPPTLRAPAVPQSGPPSFTDDPLKDPSNPESFKIKALHINELRTWINALRARRGFANYSWQQPTATGGGVAAGGAITADPIIEMRLALDQALGSPSPPYAGGLAQGLPILAVHIQELRTRVKDNWNVSSCPTIDQFIKNFYQGALARQPNSNEFQSWSSQLRQAYYQGHLLSAVQYMGRQIFKSQEYANRNRDVHWYVYDLYWAYMQREPDTPGWSFWENTINSDYQNGIDGREHGRVAFETDTTEFAPKVANLCAGSSGSSPIPLDGLASLTYDSATNRITTPGFAYDAAGNQTRVVRTDGAAQRFQYDAANRLIQVKDDYGYVLETLTYGDSNERLISEENGYRTYFDCEGGSTISEYFEAAGSTTPAWSKSYVFLGGRLLSTVAPNGNGGEAIQFHHPDRLGTRLVTDPITGTSFEQVGLPFGTAINAESTGGTNKRFTSYDRSGATGLDYANNRHYDSQQGRFTQVDPAGMNATHLSSPQTLNLYGYCINDPINHTDPSGLGFFSFLKKAFKWIGIAISVALIVVGIGGLLLAAQLPAFLPLIGSTAGLASAITAASIGMLVTGALGLVSQVVGGKVGLIAGLALMGWNVFNFLKSFSSGSGFRFGLQDGDEVLTGPCPFGACTVTIYANYSALEMAAWWAKQAASSGIAVTRSLSNIAISQIKTIAHNEMKFIRCFEANRFSADISNLTKGTRLHGAATFTAEAAEILPTASVLSDLRAIFLKSARTGIAGSEGVYASGINLALKRLAGRAIFKGVGDVATPVMAVTFAFTTGYNASKAAGCRISNPIP